mgnify:CR=1 FL=1
MSTPAHTPPVSPPRGTYLRHDGVETVIGASTRSPAAFLFVPFLVVWSGLSLGGLYGSQIAKGKFDLFLSLFGIPFLIVVLLLGWSTLMCVVGRVEVRLRHGEGAVFTGIGPIGSRERFDASAISEVREQRSRRSGRRASSTCIVLEGPRPLFFGSQLNSPRRRFMIATLRQTLGLA